jgi:putative tryptophan/tyrosine transport system substrate-binding protein
MRRREFIAATGTAALAWPMAVRAQQSAMPMIGYLSARSPDETAHLVEAFRRGLGEQDCHYKKSSLQCRSACTLK